MSRRRSGLGLAAFAVSLAVAPSAAAQQKLFSVPGSAHGGQLGASIALIKDMNGDLRPDFMVGAPDDLTAGPHAGRVQILSGTTGAVIREHFGAHAGDRFGASVCMLADNNLDGFAEYVIGSPGATVNGHAEAGLVTLYDGKTGAPIRTWSGVSAGDHFGASLAPFFAIRIVVGAPGRDAGAMIDAGSVYLLAWDSLTPIHEYTGGAAGAQLGACLDASSTFPVQTDGSGFNQILAGAPGWSAVASGAGRVVVLSSVAPFATVLAVDGTTANGHFGAAVASFPDQNGDQRTDIVVGEPGGGAGGEGRAYLVSGATGATLKTFALPGGQPGDQFGAAVTWGNDVDGDLKKDALVGAPFHGTGPLAGAGTVAAMSLATGAAVRIVNGPNPGVGFGAAIVGGFAFASGNPFNDFIVGAPSAFHVAANAGSVNQVIGSTGAIAWTAFGPTYGDHVGASVAGIGDVNGDGVADWAVGTPGLQSVEIFSGATGASLLTIPGGVSFGSTLAAVGDLNLDGLPDLAVGSPAPALSTLASVAVYSLAGSAASPLATYDSTVALDAYGFAIAPAGDYDGDGTPDVIVGAPQSPISGVYGSGRIQVRSGANASQLLEVYPASTGDQFGSSLAASGGDFDHNGNTEFFVGAPTWDDKGGVFVVGGSALYVIVLDGTASNFGRAVVAAGDIDGDGDVDLIASAPLEGPQSMGLVLAVSFTKGLLWSVQGASTNEDFGWTLTGLGDLDFDGHVDVAAGAYPAAAAGSVRILSGKTGATMTTISEPGTDTSFSQSIARVSDVDGDGLDDLVVGAPRTGLTVTDGGGAFLYSTALLGTTDYGTGTPGCAGVEHLVTNLVPKVGSTTLQLRTDHAPPSALGLGLVSNLQDAAGSELLGLGVLFHVGVAGATIFDGVNVTSDAAGHASAPFTIPNHPGLVGSVLYTQVLWSWTSGCTPSPFGLSTSRGLAITIQP